MARKNRKKPKIDHMSLKVGSFYNVHNQSGSGHPGRIEKADDLNDEYLVVITRSLTKEEYKDGKWEKKYIELKEPTSNDVYKSALHKRPFKGSRFDCGNKEYDTLIINALDEPKVLAVKKKNPCLYWLKKKKAFNVKAHCFQRVGFL